MKFFLYVLRGLELDEIVSIAAKDVHPPLYYLLLHFWTALFGQTESAARMLSVVFSVLTVFVIYRIALMLFDLRIAILTALLSALAPPGFLCSGSSDVCAASLFQHDFSLPIPSLVEK